MTSATAVLVTGSYMLSGCRPPRAWLLATLDEMAPSLITVGDSKGPAAWASAYARERGIKLRRYTLDGGVAGEMEMDRWSNEGRPPPGTPRDVWDERQLDRDKAMIEHLSAVQSFYRVAVIVMRAAHQRRCESDIIADVATMAGLAVIGGQWSHDGRGNMALSPMVQP